MPKFGILHLFLVNESIVKIEEKENIECVDTVLYINIPDKVDLILLNPVNFR